MIGNDILLNGETIISSVGAHLTQENDGNLVLYRGASPAQRNGIIWQSNYHGDEGQYFTKLQRDGNWITWNGREDNKGDYVWKTESLGSGIGDYYISVDSDFTGFLFMKELQLIWKLCNFGIIVNHCRSFILVICNPNLLYNRRIILMDSGCPFCKIDCY